MGAAVFFIRSVLMKHSHPEFTHSKLTLETLGVFFLYTFSILFEKALFRWRCEISISCSLHLEVSHLRCRWKSWEEQPQCLLPIHP